MGYLLRGPDIGSQAPQFTLLDENKTAVTYSQFRGKKIFLHFMAAWCKDCRAEFPLVQALYDRKKADPEFIFLAVAFREDPEITKKYLDKHGYDLPIYTDANGAAARGYGVRGVPTTFIINSNGIVERKLVGAGKLEGIY